MKTSQTGYQAALEAEIEEQLEGILQFEEVDVSFQNPSTAEVDVVLRTAMMNDATVSAKVSKKLGSWEVEHINVMGETAEVVIRDNR